MSNPKTAPLAAFVEWSAAHITGDEKGQAQIFPGRLFQALTTTASLPAATSTNPCKTGCCKD